MDKQNEGIQDPDVKVIPYDVGGYAAVRNWGKKRPITAKTRRRLVKHTPNIPLSIIFGQGNARDLEMLSVKKEKVRKSELTREK